LRGRGKKQDEGKRAKRMKKQRMVEDGRR